MWFGKGKWRVLNRLKYMVPILMLRIQFWKYNMFNLILKEIVKFPIVSCNYKLYHCYETINYRIQSNENTFGFLKQNVRNILIFPLNCNSQMITNWLRISKSLFTLKHCLFLVAISPDYIKVWTQFNLTELIWINYT